MYNKYLKYKKKYLNLRNKKGGTITREEIERDEVTQYYYPYISIFRDFIIPNGYIDGIRCNGDITKMYKLFSGVNGMTIQFNCENGKTYVVKFMFNLECAWQNMSEQLSVYNKEIENEYFTIKMFDSPYIMTAQKYFLFNKDSNRIIFKTTRIEENKDEQIINLPEEYKKNQEYKFSNPVCDINNIIPHFGGIILEYIPHSFNTLPKDLSYVKIEKLFYQYLLAINEINLKNCIHNDIKANNMMYSLDESGEYLAKIIDFGALYNIDTSNKQFTPATLEISHPELCRKARDITVTIPLSEENKNEFKTTILFRYDLFSLVYTFINYGFLNLKEGTVLYDLIINIMDTKIPITDLKSTNSYVLKELRRKNSSLGNSLSSRKSRRKSRRKSSSLEKDTASDLERPLDERAAAYGLERPLDERAAAYGLERPLDERAAAYGLERPLDENLTTLSEPEIIEIIKNLDRKHQRTIDELRIATQNLNKAEQIFLDASHNKDIAQQKFLEARLNNEAAKKLLNDTRRQYSPKKTSK